ncbi:MAG: C40 family peptidase [Ktedonobacteraceae bacterium]|nr:C40 family peptidase [Ktedonobacteraceae bacterium]MBO0790368.1 C40 family peptidase [Ktedonobacteraceae bacterium]
MVTYAVAVGVADVRRDPDPTSELVTQALLNRSAICGQTSGEWTHVTLSDYEGWVRTAELAEPPVKGFTRVGEHCSTPLDLAAVITSTRTELYAEATGNEQLGKVYLSSALPLLDSTQTARLQVALPGDATAWVARSAASIRRLEQPYPTAPLQFITDHARSFLGVPYLWGGTSFEGIDCSGFVQLCYRMGGSIIPRDADQQHDALPHSVTREEMRIGDLIFFGSKAITHVGMALNNKEYIHAAGGEYQRVVINSFDPAASHYNQRLDEIVWAIKRVVP